MCIFKYFLNSWRPCLLLTHGGSDVTIITTWDLSIDFIRPTYFYQDSFFFFFFFFGVSFELWTKTVVCVPSICNLFSARWFYISAVVLDRCILCLLCLLLSLYTDLWYAASWVLDLCDYCAYCAHHAVHLSFCFILDTTTWLIRLCGWVLPSEIACILWTISWISLRLCNSD